MKWNCPVCRYVKRGGRPIIGKICDDCKVNKQLMDSWRPVTVNFRELVLRSFSIFLTVMMMGAITSLWYRSIGVTPLHLAMSLLIWVVLICIESKEVKKLYKQYKELRKEEKAQWLFVLKVRGQTES